jgi:hypothetical protein
MEPKLRKNVRKSNLSKCSRFDRLRETDVWAALTPDEQTKWTEREWKNTYSQTSRLENLEELQLHHNLEKFLFLTVLSLFAQCKMHYWWLQSSNLTWLDKEPSKATNCLLREQLKNHMLCLIKVQLQKAYVNFRCRKPRIRIKGVKSHLSTKRAG